MEAAHLQGVGLAVLAGVLSGTVLVPMKYTTGWLFENTWLVYSLCAYLLSPWVVALATVPNLGEVYAAAGLAACVLTGVFGFGWGLAVVLNGIGVSLVGLSLASAILMGSSVFVGSLAPLVLRDPTRLATSTGRLIVFCNLLVVAGVLLCAWAGHLRGKGQLPSAGVPAHGATVAMRGILICLAAGLLSTLLNLALAYGHVISQAAARAGSSEFNAANAVWSVAVSSGALPSLVWCTWRLSRMDQWRLFTGPRRRRNAVLCIAMGVLWISGTVFYGAAAGRLGALGPVIGWPIYMSGIILTSSLWGWITGEWRGVTRLPVAVMSAGVATLVVAIALLGGAQ